MAQKSVLGKGLASLLPGALSKGSPPPYPEGATQAGESTTVMQQEHSSRDRHSGMSIAQVEEIVANQYQPRRDFDDHAIEELAQSIRSNGVIQPLVVRKTALGYELIAGERRLRAAKIAGLRQVPIVIRKSTDRESLELALIENIQRQNLNCIDESLAYFQLMQDFSLTQEDIAQRVGKDRATVANFLRLLKLPEAIIDDLRRQILSFGHGKALLALDDNELRLRARAQVVERRLSVRDTEALIEEMKRIALRDGKAQAGAVTGANTQSPIQSRLTALSQTLTRHWSTRVEFRGSDKKGKIVVHYSSRQELERILAAMQNEKT